VGREIFLHIYNCKQKGNTRRKENKNHNILA
jgi:hypothetical protein